MATFHRQDDQCTYSSKVRPMCCWRAATVGWSAARTGRSARDRQQIDSEYLALAEGGLRGLLIASRTIPASAFDASGDLPAGSAG